MTSANDQETLRDTIGAVLGRTPSGIFVLSAANAAGQETAMLASWVQQASFAPPMVSVCVNRTRFLHDWLDEVPRMAISLVGESQKHLLKHFAAGFEPGVPAFEGVDVIRGQTGLPVLREALGYLEGTVTGELETGDHVLYAVEITGAGRGPVFGDQKPMVHVRKSGFHY